MEEVKQFMKPESREGQLFFGPVRSLSEQVFLYTQYTVNQETMWDFLPHFKNSEIFLASTTS